MTNAEFLEIMTCADPEPVAMRRVAETGTPHPSPARAPAHLPGVHIAFTVPGQPVAKGRAKFSRKGAFVRAYTPEKTANYEGLVAYSCAQAMGGMEPLAGPLSIDLAVGVQIPVSWSKKRQAAAEAGHVRPTKKPDLDNIVKSICDGLNAVAYADDAQIVAMSVRKFYTHTPGVRVVLRVQDGETA